MDDSLDKFSELAARARGSTPPQVDVTARVLRDLSRQQPRPSRDGMLWAIAGAALLAAGVSLAVGWNSYGTLTDPLAGLFEPLSMVIQ